MNLARKGNITEQHFDGWDLQLTFLVLVLNTKINEYWLSSIHHDMQMRYNIDRGK